MTDKMSNSVAKTTAKIDKKLQGGGMRGRGMHGGGRETKRRINKKIVNTTKRINELLNRFTVRRHSKPNYTRRLNQSRC